MTDRELMQQALEALLRVQPQIRGAIPQQDVEDAIDALKAALADPTPLEDVVTHGSAWSKDGKRIDPMSVYAEPVQEPRVVAVIGNWGRVEWVDGVFPQLGDKMYSAPPQHKPLSEDEILSLFRTAGSPLAFARAVERAHGIGGEA